MGRRTRTASVAAVLAAFLTRRTWWAQAELARRVDLSTEALRKLLLELEVSGLPLENRKEHPHVYWRMGKDWYPGGVLFKEEHVPDLLRQLTHVPAGKSRDKLLGILMDQLPAHGKLTAKAPVVSRAASETEEQYVPIIEDAAAKKLAVQMRYVTASHGGISSRHVSVHVVEIGPPARFIATCHRNGDLRWFRIDGIARAHVDEHEKFRSFTREEVEAFRAASLDGYKGEGRPVAYSFFVRAPESNWVPNNLLDGMRVETLPGGIRVNIETSAVLRLARFVVALGAAARPENEVLAEAVAELAQGALEQAQAALRQEEEASASTYLSDAPVRPSSDV